MAMDDSADPFEFTQEQFNEATNKMLDKYGEDFLQYIKPPEMKLTDQAKAQAQQIYEGDTSIADTFPGVTDTPTYYNPLHDELISRVDSYRERSGRDRELDGALGIISGLEVMETLSPKDIPQPPQFEFGPQTEEDLMRMEAYQQGIQQLEGFYSEQNKLLDVGTALQEIVPKILSDSRLQLADTQNVPGMLSKYQDIISRVAPDLDPEEAQDQIYRITNLTRLARDFFDKGTVQDKQARIRLGELVEPEDRALFLYLLDKMGSVQQPGKRHIGSKVIGTLDAQYRRMGLSAQNAATMLFGDDEERANADFSDMAENIRAGAYARANNPDNWLEAPILGAAELAPAIMASMSAGAAAAGGASFALGGEAGAGALATGSSIAAQAGNVANTATQLAYWTTQEAPDHYYNLRRKGVDEKLAVSGGFIIGAGKAAIELLKIKQLEGLGNTIFSTKGLSGKYSKNLTDALTGRGLAVLENTYKQGGEEYTQELYGLSMEAFIRSLDSNAEEYTRDEIFEAHEQLYETMKKTLIGTPLLGVAGSIGPVAHDTKQWYKDKYRDPAKDVLFSPQGIVWFGQAHPQKAVKLMQSDSRSTYKDVFGKLNFTGAERKAVTSGLRAYRQVVEESLPPGQELLIPSEKRIGKFYGAVKMGDQIPVVEPASEEDLAPVVEPATEDDLAPTVFPATEEDLTPTVEPAGERMLPQEANLPRREITDEEYTDLLKDEERIRGEIEKLTRMPENGENEQAYLDLRQELADNLTMQDVYTEQPPAEEEIEEADTSFDFGENVAEEPEPVTPKRLGKKKAETPKRMSPVKRAAEIRANESPYRDTVDTLKNLKIMSQFNRKAGKKNSEELQSLFKKYPYLRGTKGKGFGADQVLAQIAEGEDAGAQMARDAIANQQDPVEAIQEILTAHTSFADAQVEQEVAEQERELFETTSPYAKAYNLVSQIRDTLKRTENPKTQGQLAQNHALNEAQRIAELITEDNPSISAEEATAALEEALETANEFADTTDTRPEQRQESSLFDDTEFIDTDQGELNLGETAEAEQKPAKPKKKLSKQQVQEKAEAEEKQAKEEQAPKPKKKTIKKKGKSKKPLNIVRDPDGNVIYEGVKGVKGNHTNAVIFQYTPGYIDELSRENAKASEIAAAKKALKEGKWFLWSTHSRPDLAQKEMGKVDSAFDNEGQKIFNYNFEIVEIDTPDKQTQETDTGKTEDVPPPRKSSEEQLTKRLDEIHKDREGKRILKELQIERNFPQDVVIMVWKGRWAIIDKPDLNNPELLEEYPPPEISDEMINKLTKAGIIEVDPNNADQFILSTKPRKYHAPLAKGKFTKFKKKDDLSPVWVTEIDGEVIGVHLDESIEEGEEDWYFYRAHFDPSVNEYVPTDSKDAQADQTITRLKEKSPDARVMTDIKEYIRRDNKQSKGKPSLSGMGSPRTQVYNDDGSAVPPPSIHNTTIPMSREATQNFNGKKVSTQEVYDTLESVWGIPIFPGRIVGNRAAGQYHTHPGIIRIKGTFYGDIGVATHEIAHAIDLNRKWLPVDDKEGGVTQGAGSIPSHLADQLGKLDYGYPNEKRAHEGFAEYLRIWLTTDLWNDPKTLRQYEMEEVHDWIQRRLRQDRKVWAKLLKTKNLINQYRSQGLKNAMSAQIVHKGKVPFPQELSRTEEGLKRLMTDGDKMYTLLKDAFHPIERFYQEAKKEGYTGPNPADTFRTLQMTGATFGYQAALEGVISFSADLKGETALKKTHDSLSKVLEDLKPDEVEAFGEWLAARQAIEYHAKGLRDRNNQPISIGDKSIEQVIDEIRNIQRDKKSVNRKGMNPGVTLAMAEAGIKIDPKQRARFEAMAKGITGFNNAVSRVLVDSGVITKETYDSLLESWEWYVPMLRMDKHRYGSEASAANRFVNEGNPIKGRTGGGQLIINPIESTIKRMVQFYGRAVKQVAMNQLIDMIPDLASDNGTPNLGWMLHEVPANEQKTVFSQSEAIRQIRDAHAGLLDPELEDAFDEIIDAVDFNIETATDAQRAALEFASVYSPDLSPDSKRSIVMVMRDGKPKLYYMHKPLYDSLVNMDEIIMPKYFEWIVSAPSQLLKLGATGLNLAFGTRNPINDWISYMFQTKQKRWNPKTWVSPLVWMGAFVKHNAMELIGKEGNPYIGMWQLLGGELTQTLGLDIKRINNTMEDVVADSTKRRALNIIKHPIRSAQSAIGVSEVGPRLAEFAYVMKKNGFTPQRVRRMLENGDYPPLTVLTEAASAAGDVTTNFKRMGSTMRWFNRAIPYLNAHIESLDKFRRTAIDADPEEAMKRLKDGDISGAIDNMEGPLKMISFAGTVASLSAVYWSLVKDKDWYKEAAPWLKYGFWTIEDENGKPKWRIPRGHHYGWMFSASIESMLDAWQEQDPDAVEKWSAGLFDQFMPSLYPATVKPALEAFMSEDGYDVFRERPIESAQLKRFGVANRYTPRTTLLSREISKWSTMVGGWSGISPVKIDHLLNGYTGGAYGRSVKAMDAFLSEGISGSSAGLMGLNIEYFPHQSVNDFYDAAEVALQEKNDIERGGEYSIEKVVESRLFEDGRRKMAELRAAGDSDELEFQRVGLARKLLKKEPLPTFVYTPHREEILKKLNIAFEGSPSDPQKEKENRAYIREWMNRYGVTKGEALRVLRAEMHRRDAKKTLGKRSQAAFERKFRVLRDLFDGK